MSYKALYRRYRPMNFDEVAGQKYIVETIKKSIINNKISHAYLFSGPRGIGKTSIARIVAKAVNCLDLHDGNPCNECENCKEINEGTSIDVIEIDAASNNGVDEIRGLLERVNFLPAKFKYKIYIIDEVHMLSTAAFNALLKTLEEPPMHVIFILATTEAYKVPLTILSRCQRFDFRPISSTDMLAQLKWVCEKENINITDEALNVIIDSAEGGMRDALSILDQVSSFKTEQIEVSDVENVTGRVSTDDLLSLITLIKDEKISDALEKVEEILSLGKEVGVLIPSLLSIYRDILLFQTTKVVNKHIYNNDKFIELSHELKRSKIFKYVDILNDCQNKIKLTNTPKIYLEVGLVKMMSKDEVNNYSQVEDVDLSDIYSRLSQLESKEFNVEDTSLREFKDYTKGKLNFLEEVVSKFSVQPQDLVERVEALEEAPSIEEVERRIETLENRTGLTHDTVDLSSVNARLDLLEQKQSIITENKESVDLSDIYERLNALEQKQINTMNPINVASSNVDLSEVYQRLENIELLIEANAEAPRAESSVDLTNIYNRLEEVEGKVNTPMGGPLPFDDEDASNIRFEQINEELVSKQDEINSIKSELEEIKLAIDELNKEDLVSIVKDVETKIQEVKDYSIKLGSRITQLEAKKEEVPVLTKRPQPYPTRPREDVNEIKKEVNEIKKEVNEIKEEVLPSNQRDDTEKVYDIKIIENILHQSRDKRNIDNSTKITSVWPKLSTLVTQELAPIASTLSTGKVIANGANYLLIIFGKASICNYLMTNQNHAMARKILRTTLAKDYDFIALPINTWEEIRTDYKNQYHAGIQYPRLKPINNPELKVINISSSQFQTQESRTKEKAFELFGKELVKEV